MVSEEGDMVSGEGHMVSEEGDMVSGEGDMVSREGNMVSGLLEIDDNSDIL
jgi:hypothetical protein